MYRGTIQNGKKISRWLSSDRNGSWWAATVAAYSQTYVNRRFFYRPEWSSCSFLWAVIGNNFLLNPNPDSRRGRAPGSAQTVLDVLLRLRGDRGPRQRDGREHGRQGPRLRARQGPGSERWTLQGPFIKGVRTNGGRGISPKAEKQNSVLKVWSKCGKGKRGSKTPKTPKFMRSSFMDGNYRGLCVLVYSPMMSSGVAFGSSVQTDFMPTSAQGTILICRPQNFRVLGPLLTYRVTHLSGNNLPLTYV